MVRLLATLVVAGCGFQIGATSEDASPPGGDAASDGPTAGDAGGADAGGADGGPCVFGPWGTPQPIAELNAGPLDSRPRLSPDELTVYFYSTRSGGAGDRDLYVAKRTSTSQPFGTPANLGELNTGSSDRDPAASADGRIIVFSSTRAGEHDVWIAERASTSVAFGSVQAIASLNTSVREYFTMLSPDGLTVWFSSNRSAGSMGGYDVWYSTRPNTASAFPAPQNLAAINTADDEYQVLVSPDGKEIYFSTERQGEIDIWVSTRADTSSSFGAASRLAQLATSGEDHPGWMSLDGLRLYYSASQAMYLTTRTCQ